MLRSLSAGGGLHLGFVIVITAPLHQVSALPRNLAAKNDCAFVGEGAWQPKEAHEAAFAGEPTFKVPPIGDGFNRTINLDGFCNDILWVPNKFKCPLPYAAGSTIGEFITPGVTTELGMYLRFDDANCPLSAIALRRNKEKTDAEVRFQFEPCQAATGAPIQPVKSAAVSMKLAQIPGPTGGANLVPFITEVCKAQLAQAPTTTAQVQQIQTKDSFETLAIGNGTCKTTGKVTKVTSLEPNAKAVNCELECQMKIKLSKAVKNEEDMCFGYAFKAGCATFADEGTCPTTRCEWTGTACKVKQAGQDDQECEIYQGGEVTGFDKADGWECKSLELKKTEVKTQTTVAPATIAPVTSNLRISQVMAGAPESMATARVFQVHLDQCAAIPPSWWFKLESNDGIPATFPVLAETWDELMALLPDPQPEEEEEVSRVVVDRILAEICPGETKPAVWGRQCIAEKVLTTCDSQQIVNAVITGVVVPVVGWLLVWAFFTRLPASCMVSSMREYQDHSSFDEGGVPICQPTGLIATCLAALIACGGLAAGTSAAVTYGMQAAGCLHGQREMMVVGVASGIPGAISFIIGILYMYFSGHKHKTTGGSGGGGGGGSSFGAGGSDRGYGPAKGHKLMLVQVNDESGRITGEPLNPDIMSTGASAMHSYSQAHGSHPILIDTHHMDPGHALASYQRPGGE